ncbi:MAG: tRNA (N6-isopentenyl adenosine(37)-C2)-methylthiotransferase MiaB [Desulfatitalea sp.]
MSTKKLFINTMGCQMNVYDSGQIQNRLAPLGFEPTDDLTSADIIMVNTCAIRAKAEQKAFSFLGRLTPFKESKPELIIAIGGCVAQQEGHKILSRMPHVDLVFGTHAIRRLPQLIQRIAATRCRIVDVEMAAAITSDDFATGPITSSDVSAFVTIMRGCDNYCTYCVVPHVRGRESSRTPEEILTEIQHLVDHGVREVTLLGQNVNSYGQKEGLCTFDQLLAMVNSIDGLARIRFTTSHPKDLSEELMLAFNRLEKLCPHIHLPVQSGADTVLRRMNRRYDIRRYLDNVARLRAIRPDIAITSDIIVGFPGETEEEFAATLRLIQQVGFDGLFAFIYSDRPNAPAVRFEHKIDEALKKKRLQAVLSCQEAFTHRKNQSLTGSVQQILVDGLSKHLANGSEDRALPDASDGMQWSGRTGTNKIVHFVQEPSDDDRNQMLTGRIMEIMIEKAMSHSLWGRPLSQPDGSSGKGAHIYAA